MLFADDMLVSRERAEEVEQRLVVWKGVMEDRGMRISRQKLMTRTREEEEEVKFQGEMVSG